MTIDKEKLQALAWFTEDHRTDKSATTYDPVVACRWYEKGWPVHLMYGKETVNALLAEIGQLKAENEALRKDAERYRFVRNPIGTTSPLAIWNEGKMPLFSSMADAVVDEFMVKEAAHD